jgi:hypothetical protein
LLAPNVFDDRFTELRKLEKKRRICRNPNPDTALWPNVYYTFWARDYTSTSATAIPRTLVEKFPAAAN